MFKWPIILGTLSAILLGGLLGGSSVSAASVWDDTVSLTPEFEVSGASGTKDFSLNWYVQTEESLQNWCDDLGGTWCNRLETFQDMLDNEGTNWFVYVDGNGFGNIVFTIDDSVTETVFDLNPYDSSPQVTFKSYGTQFKRVQVTYNDTTSRAGSEGLYVVDVSDVGTVFSLNSAHYLFLSTLLVTYPVGYEGEIIPDTYTPPTPPLDWTPDVNMVNVVDWKITLQDQNFNTFDPVPFTCDQGLTPVIEYDLYNNDTDPITLLTTGVFSPTVPFEFQSEKYETETEYKFIGSYYCGDGINTFSHQTTYYFTVNAAGTYVPPTDSCYTDTFPYIDLNGCTGVLENFLNNLSFGAISFPNWSINKDSCHTLGIIGDWLNVPASSRTICPQFPSEIRNIVTPFLTFILGITILGVIVTKSRSDTH